MKRFGLVFGAAFCVLVSGAQAGEIAPDDWSAFAVADVVVLGEVHDNPWHHANQASAVDALKPKALIFEQITPEQAAKITPEIRTDPAALATALEWEARGWPDFAMYYPIFAAAPEARIVGGGVPRDEVRRAVGEGAAAVFGNGAEAFRLDRTYTDDVQASLEALQQEAHCNALTPEMLPGMVEAQRLRDAALARAALDALRDTGGPVAVITGNGHAGKDWGVPSLLRLQPADIAVVSLGQFEEAAPDAPEFDYWIVTPAAEREDPCAVFR